jgi:hypothetical protein
MMAVDISTGSAFESRTPQRLFEIPGSIGAPAQLGNVSSPDGQRFVFAMTLPTNAAAR